jgi:hypothetical protein
VELTEVHTRGQHWWTLGFEATAALVFAHPLPGGMEPGPDQSSSYAQWLSRRPGADSDANA